MQSHKIWYKVNKIKLRILELEWTVLILKINIMINQHSTTISKEERILSRSRDILEVELLLDFHIFSIALEVHLFLQDNILSHLSSKLARTIPHPSVYLIINPGQSKRQSCKRQNKILDASLHKSIKQNACYSDKK